MMTNLDTNKIQVSKQLYKLIEDSYIEPQASLLMTSKTVWYELKIHEFHIDHLFSLQCLSYQLQTDLRQDMSRYCSRCLICQWQDCTETTKILNLPENHLFVEKSIIYLLHICPNDIWRITISSEKMPKDCKIANPWQMNLLIFDIRHLLLSIPFIDSVFSKGRSSWHKHTAHLGWSSHTNSYWIFLLAFTVC